jgi:predicted XRE-type DNA-binding protein
MTRTATKAIDYEVSSGNVYTDLGFADAAEMLAKARIVSQIGRIIQARKLTQAQAGELLGIDQPKISALLRGHFRGYSQERLIGFLTKLGMDVEIVVRPRAKKRQPAGSVSVIFA